jgi:hypothetical protein
MTSSLEFHLAGRHSLTCGEEQHPEESGKMIDKNSGIV